MDILKTTRDAAETVQKDVASDLARKAARFVSRTQGELDEPASTTGLTHAIRTRRMPRRS